MRRGQSEQVDVGELPVADGQLEHVVSQTETSSGQNT